MLASSPFMVSETCSHVTSRDSPKWRAYSQAWSDSGRVFFSPPRSKRRQKETCFLKNKVSFLSTLPFIFQCICERESPCAKDEICVPDYEDDAKHFCKCIGSGKASTKMWMTHLFIFVSLTFIK